MVASIRCREFDVEQPPSQTEQLANWISKVRSKKVHCRRSRKRNLRVEAVLTSVLWKAERELRVKQVTRIVKWQQMRQRLLGDTAYNKDGDYKDGGDPQSDYYDSASAQERKKAWSDPQCPELGSFDSFMLQLSEIKVPLQR